MKRGMKWFVGAVASLMIIAPLYWQGTRSIPRQSKSSELQNRNAQVVALDVAKTAAVSVLCLQNTLNGLEKTLQGASAIEQQNAILREFMRNHPEFVSVRLLKNNKVFIQAGHVVRPDLQKQAMEAMAQNKPFVSSMYSSKQAPVSVTIGFPLSLNSSSHQSLVADADMSHLQHLSNLLDKRMGTRTILPRQDVQTMQVDQENSVEETVRGTNWRIFVSKSLKESPSVYQGEVMARFSNGLTDSQIQKISEAVKGNLVRRNTRNVFVFKSSVTPVSQMITLLNKMGADFAEPHVQMRLQALPREEPNDTLYAPYQDNLKQIYADYAWPRATGGSNVTVAVVDTGINLWHPDLTGRLVKGINVLNNARLPQDDNGHGTHVAGIIGAKTNNSEGVAGINWACKIMPVKALGADGSGSVIDIADGIYWAYAHGANVINLSIGSADSSTYLQEAIRYVYRHGVVVVAAMGNDGTSSPTYPAAYPEVIGVSALDRADQIASFSNYGSTTSLAAPGVSIASTYLGSRYVVMSGTSMASPHVAGAAALVKSLNPRLTPYQIRYILQTTTHDLGAKGKDDYYGYGKVDVYRAVQAALATVRRR